MLWFFMEIMRKDTFLYHAVPAAPPSDAPHPSAPLSDAASAPHPAAPPPPFYFEDNSVFSEFWRTEGKKVASEKCVVVQVAGSYMSS